MDEVERRIKKQRLGRNRIDFSFLLSIGEVYYE